MGIFHVLLLLVALLFSVLIIIPDNDPVIKSLPDGYGLEDLKAKLGDNRSLNHAETRRLYRSLLRDIDKFIHFQDNNSALKRSAETCSAMRWTARLYARSRDGTYSLPILVDYFLQLRDTYVHGLRYFPWSFLQDVGEAFEGNVSFWRSRLVIRQTRDCFISSPNSAGCPSYSFLRLIKGKTDADVISTCSLSNKAYDFE